MNLPIRAGVEVRQFPLLPAPDADLVLLALFLQLRLPWFGAFWSWTAPIALATRSGSATRYQPILSTWLVTSLVLTLVAAVILRRR